MRLDKVKITSDYIKTALIHYFRFKRSFEAVATEVSYIWGIADVMAYNDDVVVEVEVKIDKSDLYKELNGSCKEAKHKFGLNKNITSVNKEYAIPNKFYFCVTENLLEFTLQYVNKINSKYGVMVFNPRNWRLKNMIIIKKQAKNLHNIRSVTLIRLIIRRLCSEIANIYQKKIEKEIKENKYA